MLDRGRLAVSGVGRDRFSYQYQDTGRVFGVKFRPGAFRPFLGRPLVEITGSVLPAERLWGPDAAALAARLWRSRRCSGFPGWSSRSCGPDDHRTTPRSAWSVRSWPRCCTTARFAASRTSPSASGSTRGPCNGCSRGYVGVSPKWVLRRYRLHEAAAALAREQHRPWADVAADLGYFDQSHFIRDFTAASTPVAYAEACRAQRAPVSV